jgi:predicted deacylase
MSDFPRLVIGGKNPGPRLLILAGVHGDECEPMLAVQQLRDSIDASELSGEVVLVPVANPSAYICAARVGEDGLDMARTFPGDAGGSITQRLAAQLTEEIRRANFLIDLHTGGRMLDILPMAGFMLHDNPQVLAVQRQMADAFNLPYVWGTTAALQGRSLSAARDAGVPAIYTEMGGGGAFRPDTVAAYVAGCLQVLAALGMTKPVPVDCQVQYRLDDWQPNSGHLQVCHPAPCDGVFLPAVRLGDWVQPGERIGTVVNGITGERIEVVAAHAGLVLMLLASAQVNQATGLCVIVDFANQPSEDLST